MSMGPGAFSYVLTWRSAQLILQVLKGPGLAKLETQDGLWQ